MTHSIPTLTTDRLTMRGPQASDRDGFVEFFTSERAKYAGGSSDTVKAQDEFAEMLAHWGLHGFGSFIIVRKDTGQAIGHVGGLRPTDWPEKELGWSIWRDADEGHGYASEAVIATRNHLFADCGWTTAISYIAPDNTRSLAFAERLGAYNDENAETPAGLRCFAFRHPNPGAA